MTTWIIVPYFCKPKLLSNYLDYLHSLSLPPDMKVVIVEDNYPIQSLPVHNYVKSQDFGFDWVGSDRNVGMQKAVNHALNQIDAEDEDVVILSDPDDYPSDGAYQALVEVIQHKSIAVAALSFKEIKENRKKLKPAPITYGVSNGQPSNHKLIDYWIHPHVDLWHIAAYRMEWINSIGGFGQAYPYWGGLESYLYERWSKQGMKLVYLTDYICDAVELDKSDPELFDKEFQEYKTIGVQQNQFRGSFAEWLAR